MGSFLLLVAAFAGLGGFLFGYDLGLIGGALLNIREQFGTSTVVEEIIVGAAKLGAFFGAFLGAAFMLRYGRRPAIAFDSAWFVVGPLLMAVAPGPGLLIAGRFVVGIGIGVSAVVVPAYLGEMSPAHKRGAIVALYEVMLCVGMLAAALVDFMLQGAGPGNWRWMVGIPIAPALLLLLGPAILPESPRWLLQNGRFEAALGTLHQILTQKALPVGANSTPEVENELLQLWNAVEHDRAATLELREMASGKAPSTPSSRSREDQTSKYVTVAREAVPSLPPEGFRVHDNELAVQGAQPGGSGSGDAAAAAGYAAPADLREDAARCDRANDTLLRTLKVMIEDIGIVARGPERNALKVAVVLAVFNQACASTAIINYAPELLEDVGVSHHEDATLYTSAIGITKTVGVCIGMSLVDSWGRRPLLIYGSAGMAGSMWALTSAAGAESVSGVLFAMCAFILAFSASWAGVFWVLMSELFSMSAKSAAVSAATGAFFLSGAVTNLVFMTFHAWLGDYSFSFFGMVSAAGGFYVWAYLPETRGRSLSEVQALINGRRRDGPMPRRPGDPEELHPNAAPRPAGASNASEAVDADRGGMPSDAQTASPDARSPGMQGSSHPPPPRAEGIGPIGDGDGLAGLAGTGR